MTRAGILAPLRPRRASPGNHQRRHFDTRHKENAVILVAATAFNAGMAAPTPCSFGTLPTSTHKYDVKAGPRSGCGVLLARRARVNTRLFPSPPSDPADSERHASVLHLELRHARAARRRCCPHGRKRRTRCKNCSCPLAVLLVVRDPLVKRRHICARPPSNTCGMRRCGSHRLRVSTSANRPFIASHADAAHAHVACGHTGTANAMCAYAADARAALLSAANVHVPGAAVHDHAATSTTHA